MISNAHLWQTRSTYHYFIRFINKRWTFASVVRWFCNHSVLIWCHISVQMIKIFLHQNQKIHLKYWMVIFARDWLLDFEKLVWIRTTHHRTKRRWKICNCFLQINKKVMKTNFIFTSLSYQMDKLFQNFHACILDQGLLN